LKALARFLWCREDFLKAVEKDVKGEEQTKFCVNKDLVLRLKQSSGQDLCFE
jgi:hypothetical protein